MTILRYINQDSLERLYVPILAFLFIFLSIFMFITDILAWRGDWQLAHAVSDTRVDLATKPRGDLVQEISSANIFGDAPAKPSDVPVTNQALKVTGILINEDDKSQSRATISNDNQPSKVYQVGDEVLPQTKIYEITADAIILEHNGKLEKVMLIRTPLEFKSAVEEEE